MSLFYSIKGNFLKKDIDKIKRKDSINGHKDVKYRE